MTFDLFALVHKTYKKVEADKKNVKLDIVLYIPPPHPLPARAAFTKNKMALIRCFLLLIILINYIAIVLVYYISYFQVWPIISWLIVEIIIINIIVNLNFLWPHGFSNLIKI